MPRASAGEESGGGCVLLPVGEEEAVGRGAGGGAEVDADGGVEQAGGGAQAGVVDGGCVLSALAQPPRSLLGKASEQYCERGSSLRCGGRCC